MNQPKDAALNFDEIVALYSEKLYWHIRKIVLLHDDAHDVLQNTFLKAWKGLNKFKGNASVYTWLYRIATNEAITFFNKKKKQNSVSLTTYEDFLSKTLEGDAYFDGDKMQLKLQQAILQLPEKQRVVFNMRYFEEVKYKAMSEILGTSEGALKASYHHAVKKIEKLLLLQEI